MRCRRTYVLNKMVSLNTLPFKDSPLSFWTDVQEYIWISSLVIITTRSLPLKLQSLICRLSTKTKSLRLYKTFYYIQGDSQACLYVMSSNNYFDLPAIICLFKYVEKNSELFKTLQLFVTPYFCIKFSLSIIEIFL